VEPRVVADMVMLVLLVLGMFGATVCSTDGSAD
jgi:hypothetical protein